MPNLNILLLTIIAFASVFSLACEDDCAVICADGEACVDGICLVGSGTCDDGCTTGQECIEGQCIVTSEQCSEANESCDPSRQVAAGYLCLDLDAGGPSGGSCVVDCNPDGSCESGALCFFVQSPTDDFCITDDDCEGDKACTQGVCRDTICRPSECEGFLRGDATCAAIYDQVSGFGDGAICRDLPNDAKYCFPAGQQELGAACISFDEALAIGDFSETCAQGMGCVDNACVTACLGDDACSGDDTCLLANENLLGEGVGFCGAGCEPFAEDVGCGPQKTCLPVAASTGICVGTGQTALFESCLPGERACVVGTLCTQLQAANEAAGIPLLARCLPVCDVSVGDGNVGGGAVGELEQTLRDATCPNVDAPPANLAITNLSTVAVDLYFGNEPTPRAEALAPGMVADASPAVGVQYFELPSGVMNYKALRAGAPTTDAPLIEGTLALTSGVSTMLRLAAKAGSNEELLSWERESEAALAEEPTRAQRLWVHASEDLGAVDVVSVPAGDDLSDPSRQVELVANFVFGESRWVSQMAVESRDILVFDVNADRSERLNVLLSLDASTAAAGSRASVAITGTRDLGDLADLALVEFAYLPPSPVVFVGPAFTCVDLGNGVYGSCQQSCGQGTSGYGSDVCQGQGMGCGPRLVEGPRKWRNMCEPVGTERLGDVCDPRATYGQCGEGLYCQEFGNTAPNHNPDRRGFCNSLCVEDDVANPTFSCAMGEACRPLDFGPDFSIGQCAFECMPDTSYGDDSCPSGLQACLPSAALIPDLSGMNPPRAKDVQSYCKVSGDIQVGESCSGNDCVAGSECQFPRSRQVDFLSSLFSPYVGGAGLEATCTPQCDPFGGAGPQSCQSGETCLMNFPLSADVGHCAKIGTEVAPGDPCGNPGEACGPDAICLVNGDGSVCFQFCEYVGPDAQGMYQPETCAAGLVCAPLGNDVGVCLAP